jgi:pyrroline-5-carboxylate reductase
MAKKQAVRLCCLGGGKMGEALVRGLLEAKTFAQAQIRVVDPDSRRREIFKESYGLAALATPVEAELYLLAVKPQDFGGVLESIRPFLDRQPLLVSIAAGISTGWIRERVGEGAKVVRAMPNAAAVVGASATGVYFSPGIGEDDRQAARRIFDAVGITVTVEKEDHLNIITGLSGSGPGYVFLLLEAFTDAGVLLGLSRDVAARLALQTFLGSSRMAVDLKQSFPTLKAMITSPGGTTMAGLKELEEGAVRGSLMRAVEAATRRSRELSS